MQDAVDETIQRLYRACIEGGNFPGVVPDQTAGAVTTETILLAMGFSDVASSPRLGHSQPATTSRLSPLSSQHSQTTPLQHHASSSGSSVRLSIETDGDAVTELSQSASKIPSDEPDTDVRSSALNTSRSTSSGLDFLDMDEQFDEDVYRPAKSKPRQLSRQSRPHETPWQAPGLDPSYQVFLSQSTPSLSLLSLSTLPLWYESHPLVAYDVDQSLALQEDACPHSQSMDYTCDLATPYFLPTCLVYSIGTGADQTSSSTEHET